MALSHQPNLVHYLVAILQQAMIVSHPQPAGPVHIGRLIEILDHVVIDNLRADVGDAHLTAEARPRHRRRRPRWRQDVSDIALDVQLAVAGGLADEALFRHGPVDPVIRPEKMVV